MGRIRDQIEQVLWIRKLVNPGDDSFSDSEDGILIRKVEYNTPDFFQDDLWLYLNILWIFLKEEE